MGLLWDSFRAGILQNSYGISVKFLWQFHDISMIFLWGYYGMSIESKLKSIGDQLNVN